MVFCAERSPPSDISLRVHAGHAQTKSFDLYRLQTERQHGRGTHHFRNMDLKLVRFSFSVTRVTFLNSKMT